MGLVKLKFPGENWTREGIACDGCSICWWQDEPHQALEYSRFRTAAGMFACSEECQQSAELIFSYIDIVQDKDNIRFPVFRWRRLDPTLDIGGGI